MRLGWWLLGCLVPMAGGIAEAATLERLSVQTGFETAGVFAVVAGATGEESLDLEVRPVDGELMRAAHPLVRVDPATFASSLFGLEPGRTYEVRVTLRAGGAEQGTLTERLTTRAEPRRPAPRRVVDVPAGGSLQQAVDAAQPGDEIRVAPGTYREAVTISVSGTPDAPIVLRGDGAERSRLSGEDGGEAAFLIDGQSDWVIENLEITGYGGELGKGVYLRAARRITVRGCHVHDNGYWNILVSRGGFDAGEHLIEDNVIGDDDHAEADPSAPSNEALSDRPYYGIKLDNDPGPGTIIRKNRVYGAVDGISFCGDEGRAPEDPDADMSAWSNRNLELYDNDVSDNVDDDLESDGVCINARIFRNVLGPAQNAISVAPAFPGPYFFLRNVARGFRESSVKFNTRVAGVIRGLRFYHNTFERTSPGITLTLWDGVPSRDVLFRNNVFVGTGTLIDMQPEAPHRPDLDWDLWWSAGSDELFVWQDQRFADFTTWASASGREANGVFEDPGLREAARPAPESPVVDRGVALPGINDGAPGAPDLGAWEIGQRASGGGGVIGDPSGGAAAGPAGAPTGGGGGLGGGARPPGSPGGEPGGGEEEADGRQIRGTCAFAHGSDGTPLGLLAALLLLRRRRRTSQ